MFTQERVPGLTRPTVALIMFSVAVLGGLVVVSQSVAVASGVILLAIAAGICVQIATAATLWGVALVAAVKELVNWSLGRN